jgi:hypothetical protein
VWTPDWKQEQQPEDNGHPNKDKTSTHTDRETGRQTDGQMAGCVMWLESRTVRAEQGCQGVAGGRARVGLDRTDQRARVKSRESGIKMRWHWAFHFLLSLPFSTSSSFLFLSFSQTAST